MYRIAAFFLFAFCLIGLGQNKRADESIAGTVVSSMTGLPLAEVGVLYETSQNALVRSKSAGMSPLATTDKEGHFEIRKLSPGTYYMAFRRSGYVTTNYGQRFFDGGDDGIPITIVAGQTTENIQMRMIPTTTVSGRIRDVTGMPIAGIPVTLFRYAFGSNGKRTTVIGGSSESDDRGEYRLPFVIPGSYFLAGGSNASLQFVNALRAPRREPFPSVYYPGTTDPSQATLLEIAPGMELNGMDLTLQRSELFKITGRVVLEDTAISPGTGGPEILLTPGVGIQRVDGSYAGQVQYAPSYDPNQWTFELKDVPSGTYQFQVRMDISGKDLPM